MTVNTYNRKMDSAVGQFVTGLLFMLVTTCGWSAEIVLSEFDPLSMLETDSRIQTKVDDANDLNHPGFAIKEPVTESPSASIAKINFDITQNSSMLLQQQLWKARISTTPETENDTSKTELDRLIEKISAMEFKPQPQRQPTASPSHPDPVVMPVTKTDPNETVSDADSPDQPPPAIENKIPDGAISPETLTQLKVLSQTPEQLIHPFQMAEILYRSGYLTEAADCYQAALDRMANQENQLSQDKAWILFQLGNCLKSSNPQSAQEKYQAVIAEFPLSPWAPLAIAKSDAIAWFLKDQPVKLLEESRERIPE